MLPNDGHGDQSAPRAEQSYDALLKRFASDGYGLEDPSLIALATEKVIANRAFNRAFRFGA
jgi:hypothetical protein